MSTVVLVTFIRKSTLTPNSNYSFNSQYLKILSYQNVYDGHSQLLVSKTDFENFEN